MHVCMYVRMYVCMYECMSVVCAPGGVLEGFVENEWVGVYYYASHCQVESQPHERVQRYTPDLTVLYVDHVPAPLNT